MTPYAHSGPPLPSHPRSAARHKPGAGRAFLGGAVAAGLGLGAFATLVLVLWIVSPYPDSGPAGALHIATGLWLLAHGADLVRTETLSGSPAPVGLTPLLFSVVPCLLIHRAARQAPMPPDDAEHADEADEAIEADEADESGGPGDLGGPGGPGDARGDGFPTAASVPPGTLPAPWEVPLLPAQLPVPPLPPRTAFTALLGGYLLVSAAAVLYASSGPIRVDPLSALIHVPLVAAVPAAAGVWMAVGCPPWTPSARVRRVCRVVPGFVRRWFTAPHVVAVARAAAAGTATLFGGAALLLAASLAVHAGAVRDAVEHLTVGWPGQLGVALLSVALLPNAVVWTAAYGLGPGFAAGVDGLVAPLALPVLGSPDRSPLPPFPLLAALPAPGEAEPVGLAGAAALVTAVGIAVAAAAVPRRPAAVGRRETAAVAFLAALLCAAVAALLAYAAGGPLGVAALSRFGPSWRLTGLACLAWTLVIGVPGALVVRRIRREERAVTAPDGSRPRGWGRKARKALGLRAATAASTDGAVSSATGGAVSGGTAAGKGAAMVTDEKSAPDGADATSAAGPSAPRRVRPWGPRAWWRGLARWLGFAVGGDGPDAGQAAPVAPEQRRTKGRGQRPAGDRSADRSADADGPWPGAPDGSWDGPLSGSRDGSRIGSRDGSRNGSREGSRDGSRDGSRNGSRDGESAAGADDGPAGAAGPGAAGPGAGRKPAGGADAGRGDEPDGPRPSMPPQQQPQPQPQQQPSRPEQPVHRNPAHPVNPVSYAPESLPLLPVHGIVLGADGRAEPPRRRHRGARVSRAERAARRQAARTARREAKQAARRARKARKSPMPPVPGPAPAGRPEGADWHDTDVRQARWAAMKDSGGGLMPDFEPRDPARLLDERWGEG
ncbi:DUF6350 family protein [Streptomyces sp. TYQ1024]|uniref:cell division protein PerM n=1 Tax=Streptomyces sp. TYQ1024 TaxID=2762559 RepID=UPI0037DBFA70